MTVTKADFYNQLRERILILDGAMGSLLLSHALREEDFRGEEFADHPQPLRGNLELLTLTRPDLIETTHRSYLNAGADIITTNTLSAIAVMQQRYGAALLVPRINRDAARLARSAADDFLPYRPDRPIFVAGSIGPTDSLPDTAPDRLLPSCPRLPAETLRIAYREQIESLASGGVDILLVETITSIAGAVVACEAVADLFPGAGERPLLGLAATTDSTGRHLPGGESLEQFIAAVTPFAPDFLGLNCGYGPASLTEGIRLIDLRTPLPLALYPGAGLPDEFGEYPETPESFTDSLARAAGHGSLNIAGGCCGTTFEHIRTLSARMESIPPRPLR